MVLVTGGTGLVGSHLMLELSLKGKKIRALLRAGSNVIHAERVFKSYPELWKKIEWVEGDVTDVYSCLLYTSDAADERSSVDLGGRRIIKKKKKIKIHYDRHIRE